MATLLETDAVLKRGVSELALADPVMAKLAESGITPQLRRRPPGFEGLSWIVVGQQVAAGDVVGTLSDERSHCADACLHWGVRDGLDYLDPLTLLPGGGPVVLLPDEGG